MSLARSIAWNAIITTGARVVGTGVALVTIGFLARYLGKEGFGEYVAAFAFLFIFSVLADLGLYTLLTREISRPGADEKKIVSNLFTLRASALVFFLGLAPLFSLLFPYSPALRLAIIAGAFSYLFLSLAQVLMGVFQKYLRMEMVAIADVAGRLVQFGLVLAVVKIDGGLLGAALAATGGAALNFLIVFLASRRFVRFGLRFDFSYWSFILHQALPIAASLVLTLIYFKIDTVMLSAMKPAGDVGIYGVAYKVLEGLIFFPAVFVGIMLPLLTLSYNTNRERFLVFYQRTFDAIAILALPAAVGIFLLSKPITALVGGSDFPESALALAFLAPAIFFIAFGALFGQMIIVLGRQKTGAWIYLAGAVFNFGANLIFIPKYSYLGAAATTVATEILVTVLMFWLVARVVNWCPALSIFGKAVLATAVMAAAVWYLTPLNVLAPLIGGAVIYLTTLYFLGGIREEEIRLLFRRQV